MLNYEKELKQLRNKLVRDQMSVLVGAGFSMNVHPDFLSWSGLLYDLIKEVYNDDIERAWQLNNRELSLSEMPETFVKEQCLKITNRVGYLEVVEEYIRQKGYPEAIVTYIEKRTPVIQKNGGRFLLHTNGDIVELPAEKLSLHQKLIRLPWNNIYTTNYDELLDCFVGEDQVAQLRQEISELEKENYHNYEEKSKVTTELSEMPDDPQPVEQMTDGRPVGQKADISEAEDLSEIEERRKSLEERIKLLEDAITENEQALRDKETLLLRRYDVVRSAADLRLKRTKNIIKLHGSLRSFEQRKMFEFGFDSDPHKQYVISRSHFDNYPEQHQAFTQLMRIALLQESFCLIGFSGQDPNFKAWLNWVKDILHKEAVKNNRHNYKIYLIDVAADEISEELRLFYENHSIVRIPLQHNDVVKFLNQHTEGAITICDDRSALLAFILFLENADHNNFDIPQIQLPLEETRKRYWANLGIVELTKLPDVDKAKATLQELKKIDNQVWFPNFDYSHTMVPDRLIRHAKLDKHLVHWREIDQDHNLKTLLLKAVSDLFIPVEDGINEELRLIIAQSILAPTLDRLMMRNQSLRGIYTAQQTVHDKTLAAAYSFDFAGLFQTLNNWKTVGREQISRSGFLSLFDLTGVINDLWKLLEEGSGLNEEEALYGYELLNFIKISRSWNRDKKIARILRSYEKAGYQTLDSRFKTLRDDLKKRESKPEPLGYGRYDTGRSTRVSKRYIADSALQYLMILGESGFQLCLPRVYRIDVNEWWEIQLAGFEHYPSAFLFYSLQYSDNKFLNRVGQEYAYSDVVQPQLAHITQQLLTGYEAAPGTYKQSILQFLSTAIIAVDPDSWEPGFTQLWQYFKENKEIFDTHRRKESFLKFFENGIKYITKTATVQMVIADSLKQIQAGVSEQAITYLYLLNQNEFHRRQKIDLSIEIDSVIDDLISKLKNNKEDVIYALGNIHTMLRPEQLELLHVTLNNFDFSKIENSNSWSIFLYFIGDDEHLRSKLKQGIIDSGFAFYTGVKDETASFGGINYLVPLRRISATSLKENGLEWLPEEVKSLYYLLRERIVPLKRFLGRADEIFSFTEVLEEMYWFLEKFSDILKDEPGFKEQFEEIKVYYYRDRNYEELESGLISEVHGTVVWALSELSTAVYVGTATAKQVSLVVYRVLLQNEPALEASISYIAAWMEKLTSKEEFAHLVPLLSDILKKYRDTSLDSSDQAFVKEKLVRIAADLHRSKHPDEHTKWWLEWARTSCFNNVKQYVARLPQAGSI
ncbi:SIR2 family protein [Mucilaginibacter pocheonensis]|uniref:SIR2-like domain-containing protein n=1 Tax=Mucilaginibacter pocheonensis TaxID=398050 RepID=A0ABU1TC35_9SPHI|nr:SIR2 family protein [Mucilaginibacter pocheonensis]MDR6942932.1 hypothetical protein [Mucilaginibacter pocheonensis]